LKLVGLALAIICINATAAIDNASVPRLSDQSGRLTATTTPQTISGIHGDRSRCTVIVCNASHAQIIQGSADGKTSNDAMTVAETSRIQPIRFNGAVNNSSPV
jgi:hypothetical protein